MGIEQSLTDFYAELNPLNLIKAANRSFAETLILFLYLVLFSILLYRLILFLVEKFKPSTDVVHEYNRRKIIRAFTIGASIFVYLPIIFSSLELLPTVLGFAGAGIVISLKEYWLSIVGWVMILGSNGFKVGDRVQIDGVLGDVVNIGFLRFTLVEVSNDPRSEQSTNRLVHFPNYYIVSQRFFLVTDAMDFVWDEFPILLDLDTNWEKAESICKEILEKDLVHTPAEIDDKLRELSKNYLVRLGATTPIVYTSLEEGAILLSLRYLTPIRAKRTNHVILSREVLKRFRNESDLHFKR